jgi:hypothetical protein
MSLNWNLDPLDQAPDANLSTPERKFSSQRMEAGGGSLNGGAQLVLLNSLDCVHEGGATCTYLRGKDKRTICMVQNCGMTSQKNAGSEKRFAFGDGVQGVLVIQTGPDVALAKPTARPGLFGSGLERYLKERR